LLPMGFALIPSISSASCGAAFCAVNTNWTSESAMVDAGSAFDLRYEHINQDQPQAGSKRVAVGQIRRHHDEVSTLNRNLLMTYSHSFSSGWGITASAPIQERNHTHIHNHHGAQFWDKWNYTKLGDVRVTGRYQLPFVGDPHKPVMSGLTFGLKLPTGKSDVANAQGALAERSMQPGTGTTDLLVGAYYHQKAGENAAWFVQAQLQHALNSHHGYKPGSQIGADVGYRRRLSDRFAGLIQLNLVKKRSDSGNEAEPDNTGNRAAFLSPGVSYALFDNVQIYGFYQYPLYQHVEGVQLTARRAFVVGASGKF
ncbi:MAG: transporter, partial [Paucimonas sp.]|nr:transporter [Paucimonas sp.]